jgi:hypothetical protein
MWGVRLSKLFAGESLNEVFKRISPGGRIGKVWKVGDAAFSGSSLSE